MHTYNINKRKKRKKNMEQTLAQKAYLSIKKLIISNHYFAGVPLQEQELVKKLHISRTPIREALIKLKHENLIEIIPKKGAFVSKISVQQLQELLQIREIIEPKITELASVTISIEKLYDVERQLLHLKTNKEIDYLKFFKAGQKLHNLILDSIENKTLIQIFKGLNDEINRACLSITSESGNAQKFLEQHLAITDALKARDGRKAKQKMLEHLLSIRSSIIE